MESPPSSWLSSSELGAEHTLGQGGLWGRCIWVSVLYKLMPGDWRQVAVVATPFLPTLLGCLSFSEGGVSVVQ